MELIKHADYREVQYHGVTLEIPAHHNYVATDENGFTYSFSELPDYQGGFWAHDDDVNPHDIQFIALFDLEDMKSMETLVEYPREKVSLI